VGAIGVGSGTGDQDVEVARAGLATLGAQDFPPG
jgi:glc operon protein GlcG